MGGRNIFLPGRLFPRKFPGFSGGVEEIANPEISTDPGNGFVKIRQEAIVWTIDALFHLFTYISLHKASMR